jgi:hypothetical protein
MIVLSMIGCSRDTEQQLNDAQNTTATLPDNEIVVKDLEQPVAILVAMHCLDFSYDKFSASNDSISSYVYNYANIFHYEKMLNQTISFTNEEIDQALNLAFGTLFSSNNINVNDADDYMSRPLYSNGVFSFKYGEAVRSDLIFLSSPNETTYIYEYRFNSVPHNMDESGIVTVNIEASADNPYGFSIKSLQVSPLEFNSGEVLPEQIDITVTREGLEDTRVGTLAISSRFDYAVYILPGFIFVELNDNDNIESTPIPNFIVHLCEVDPSNPMPNGEIYEGTRSIYRRVDLGDKTIEAMINYPNTTEHEEGGLVLLLAMVDTITNTGR